MKRKTILALLLAVVMLLSAGTSLAWGDKGWYLEPELDKFGTETGYNNVVYAFSGKDSRKSAFSGTIAFNASTWTICIDGEDGKTVSFAEQLVGGYSISLKAGKNVTENLENAATFGDSIVFPIGSNRTADLAIALLQGQDVILLLEGDYSPTYILKISAEGFSEQWFKRAQAIYEIKKYEQAEDEFAILASYNYSGAAAQVQKCEDAIYGPSYAAAKALYDAGEYEKAMAAFKKLDSYSDSKTQVKNCQEAINSRDYLAAKALYDAGKYEQAKAAFEALGTYSDSKKQVANCEEAINNRDYNAAKALREAGKYEEAAAAFEKLGAYSDSTTQITETKYQQAKALYGTKEYAGAYAIFATIKGYKDVDTLLSTDDNLAAAAAARDAAWQPGKYVTFGHYEQDNNTSNGKESIEWLVLARNGSKALILSRYGLDSKAYNEKWVDITWEKCTLRTWLNKDFLNAAFTTSEQAAIQTTAVDNSKSQGYSGYSTNGGNNTKDKVFLLSYAEAWKYFSSDEARKCVPTAYAIAQGAYQSSSEKTDGKATGVWWLRSPGDYRNYATGVDTGGSRCSGGVSSAFCVVRPALWVDIESGI